MKYQIHPVYLGYRDMAVHDIIYRARGEEIIRMAYGVFILKGEDGSCVMIDSGPPSRDEIIQKGYPARHPADNFVTAEEVRKAGVKPEDVQTIIYTHLHWDHAWNVGDFPNAKLIVQEKEMDSAIHPLKIAVGSYGFFPQSGGPDWLRGIMRVKPVRGDCEILPGIRVITTPGHTAGSQSVLVDTAEGTYLIPGDWIMNLRSLELELPSGSTPDVPAWYQSLDKIKALDLAGILPGHDPRTYERPVWG